MGMREYAVSDFGLIIDNEAAKNIAMHVCSDAGKYKEDEYICWEYEIYEEGLGEYISEFTGEAICIANDGTPDFSSDFNLEFDCDVIAYIPLNKTPTLIKAAYENINEIIDELKEKLGKYLSEEFDYRNNIRIIIGTYYG